MYIPSLRGNEADEEKLFIAYLKLLVMKDNLETLIYYDLKHPLPQPKDIKVPVAFAGYRKAKDASDEQKSLTHLAFTNSKYYRGSLY